MTGSTIFNISTQDLLNMVSIGINESLSLNLTTVVRRNNFNNVTITIPEESLTGTIDLSYNGDFTVSGNTQAWNQNDVQTYVSNTLDMVLAVGKTVRFPYQDGYVIMEITEYNESIIPTKNNAQLLQRKSITGTITNSVNTEFEIGSTLKINPLSWDLLIT